MINKNSARKKYNIKRPLLPLFVMSAIVGKIGIVNS